MKKEYIYMAVALVVIAAVCGFIYWKKKQKRASISSNSSTSALAQKQDKTIVLKKA